MWRFRIVALLLMGLAVLMGYRVFQYFSGATAQDPGLSSYGAVVSSLR